MNDITINERGSIVCNGMVIGRVQDAVPEQKSKPQVILNAGWCSEAGVDIRVLADPDVDRKRGGVLLDRPAR